MNAAEIIRNILNVFDTPEEENKEPKLANSPDEHVDRKSVV